VRVAIQASDDEQLAPNTEYERRRDAVMAQLASLPVVTAQGGWSLLLDVAALGLDCVKVSNRLLERKVAATPMRDGAARSPTATSASSSAASPSSASRFSVTAFEQRWLHPTEECGGKPRQKIRRSLASSC
jgi:aspartate/methionine/tyrosine aminotransferase